MTAPDDAPRRRRTAGARFSAVDAAAIAICAGGTWALWDLAGAFVWIGAVALGHFFLFCNVFRVRRNYELLWTAVFLANFTGWLTSGAFSWLGVLAVQTPLTALLIGAEVRSREYHGIFSRRLNPDLDAWLAGDDDGTPLLERVHD